MDDEPKSEGAAGAAEEPREMGEQPLAAILRSHGLSNHDVVAASARPISHKLVMRALRGRRLTLHSKALVVEAVNRAVGASYKAADLFNY